jgi:DNA topoisomerase VI subunit A
LPRAKDPSGSVVGKIVDSVKDIRGEIIGGRKPSTTASLRSLSNVRLTPRRGYLERVGRKKERTLAVSTARTFAQTLRRVALFTPGERGTHPIMDRQMRAMP